jgi:hypothetical protein
MLPRSRSKPLFGSNMGASTRRTCQGSRMDRTGPGWPKADGEDQSSAGGIARGRG